MKKLMIITTILFSINLQAQNLGSAILGATVGIGWTTAQYNSDNTDFVKVFGSQPAMWSIHGFKIFIDAFSFGRYPTGKTVLIGQVSAFAGSLATKLITDIISNRKKRKQKLKL